MGFSINYNQSSLKSGLGQFSQKFGALLLMYASTKSEEIESYMKKNRVWTDRTNDAKATLNTKVTRPNEDVVRITLAHGVYYGIWLELANEKNYAIIKPTIDVQGPKLMSDMSELINKIEM